MSDSSSLIRDRVVCLQCDAIHAYRPLNHGEVARCTRCGAPLGSAHRLGVEGLFALTLAALIVFAIAQTNAIVTLNLRGYHNEATLWKALVATWQAGETLVASLAGLTVLVAPAGVLTLRAYVLGYLMFHRVPPGFRIALRLLALTQRWGMIEVFLLGVLVALVRLAGLATLQAGPGLTAFAVFTVLITSVEAGGLHRLWDWLDQSSPTRETA